MGKYLYLNLNQVIQSFVLKNPNAVIYAKGKKQSDFLATHLYRKIENLDEMGRPRIENLYFKNYPA